jgi:hypothetical protein
MKKFKLLILVLIGMTVFLAGCPYPGSPTRDPGSLQVSTRFIDKPEDSRFETLRAFYRTPYVVQLGTQLSTDDPDPPKWFYTITPRGFPEKIKLGTRPSAFFDILRAYVTLCDGQYYAVAQVINLGGLFFESAALSVHNLSMSSLSPPLNHPFNQDSNDCPVGKGLSKLIPGAKAYLYQPFEPSKTSPCVNYLITLCSKNDLGGYCAQGGTGVCQYAVDEPPKATPTPTTVSCDFDCDCEPNRGENEYNCPKDCPKHCGNGDCDCGETKQSCKKDCGAPDDQQKPCQCGDGICNKDPGCNEQIKCVNYNDCP